MIFLPATDGPFARDSVIVLTVLYVLPNFSDEMIINKNKSSVNYACQMSAQVIIYLTFHL